MAAVSHGDPFADTFAVSPEVTAELLFDDASNFSTINESGGNPAFGTHTVPWWESGQWESCGCLGMAQWRQAKAHISHISLDISFHPSLSFGHISCNLVTWVCLKMLG